MQRSSLLFWWEDFFQFLATLPVLPRTILNNRMNGPRMNSSNSSKSSGQKHYCYNLPLFMEMDALCLCCCCCLCTVHINNNMSTFNAVAPCVTSSARSMEEQLTWKINCFFVFFQDKEVQWRCPLWGGYFRPIINYRGSTWGRMQQLMKRIS